MTMTWQSETPTCSEVLDILEAYLDGDLEPNPVARIEAHLRDCPACAHEHREALRIRDELRALPELDPPPRVMATALQAADRGRDTGPELQAAPPLSRRSWLGLAAAAVLAVAIGTVAVRTRPAPETGVDPAAVARATDQARYALALVADAGRRATVDVRERVAGQRIVSPAVTSLNRALILGPGPVAGSGPKRSPTPKTNKGV